MIGNSRQGSLMKRAEAELGRPIRDVLVELLEQEQSYTGACRKLKELSGFDIKLPTFKYWCLREGIRLEIRVKS